MSQPSKAKSKGPEQVYQAGQVRAAVWQNANEQGDTWFSTTITKNVRDKEGNFREVSSFGKEDLDRVGQVAGQARDYIRQQEQQREAQSSPDASQQYGRANGVAAPEQTAPEPER